MQPHAKRDTAPDFGSKSILLSGMSGALLGLQSFLNRNEKKLAYKKKANQKRAYTIPCSLQTNMHII